MTASCMRPPGVAQRRAGRTCVNAWDTRARLCVRYVRRAACSPWSPPFPPPAPRPIVAPCSRASSVLCWCLTAQARASPASSATLPGADHPVLAWPVLTLPVPAQGACTHAGGLRPRRAREALAITCSSVLPSTRPPASALWMNSFRGAMARLRVPLPTSRLPPHGDLRTARGRGGSLGLPRNGLAPYTPYRSPGKSGRSVTQRGPGALP